MVKYGLADREIESTVTLVSAGDKSEVSLRMLLASAEQRKFVVKTYGAHQTLGRMEEYLAHQAV